MKSYRNYIFFVFLSFVFVFHCNEILAQQIKSDMQLLQENDNYKLNKNNSKQLNQKSINNTNPIEFKHNNAIVKYNPVSLILKGSMLFYQRVVSPQLFRHCIYEISCSNYSKQAIQHFGMIKGVFLSADRLMRCNTMVKEEIPSYQFDKKGLAIDEPTKYDTH